MRLPLALLLLCALAAIYVWLAAPFSSSSSEAVLLLEPDSAVEQSDAAEGGQEAGVIERSDVEQLEPKAAELAVVEEAVDGANLQVVVLSPEGAKLAGVPVAIWTSDPTWVPILTQKSVTDEAGEVNFLIPQRPDKLMNQITVGFPFPCGKSKTIEFKQSAVPQEVIYLELAETGVVEVQLLGPGNETWTTPMLVSLTPVPGLFKKATSKIGSTGHGYALLDSDYSGKVVFPKVGIGTRYVVGIVGNTWGKWSYEKFSAPSKAGELVKVELKLREPLPLVRFRLLDPSGKPVVNRPWKGALVEYRIRPGGYGEQPRMQRFTTDSKGYSTIAAPPTGRQKLWSSRILLLSCELEDGGPVLHADVDLTPSLSHQLHDIGDVKLQPHEDLITGQVHLLDYLSVDNLTLRARAKIVIRGDDLEATKLDHLPLEVVWKEDGSFIARGSTIANKLELTLTADGIHKLSKEVDVGSNDVDFILESSYLVSGYLEIPKRYNLLLTVIYFLPPGSTASGTGHTGVASRGDLQDDGTFSISGIRGSTPGEVVVFYARGEAAIAQVFDVTPVLHGGEQDARLNPLRIVDANHYNVSFVDSSGAGISFVKYRFLTESKSDGSFRHRSFSSSSTWGGIVELNSPESKIRLMYWAEGYLYGEQDIVPGVTTITPKEAIRGILELQNSPDLPPGMTLSISMSSDIADGLLNTRQKLPTVLPPILPPIPIPAPGTYTLELYLRDQASSSEVLVPWQDGSESQQFVVTDEDGQVFKISFPNDNIRLAAEKFEAGE